MAVALQVVPAKLARPMAEVMDAQTPHERLLGLGRLLEALPKVSHAERMHVQEWIREAFAPDYIDVAHRFVLAPPSYILRCMLEGTPLAEMAQELRK